MLRMKMLLSNKPPNSSKKNVLFTQDDKKYRGSFQRTAGSKHSYGRSVIRTFIYNIIWLSCILCGHIFFNGHYWCPSYYKIKQNIKKIF